MDGLPDLPRPNPLGDPTQAFPAPTTTEPTVSVVIQEEPKKRRTGLFVGLGVLLVAALAAGGALALTGNKETATYSLSAAAAAAAETKAVAFTMTVSVMGNDITAEAEANMDTGLSHVSMDLGSALGPDGAIEIISDTDAQVFYINSDVFASLGMPVDTDWIKVDAKFLQDQSGDDTSIFDSLDMGNPLDAAALFAEAKSVKDLGFDEVAGTKVKHYEVVVDTQAAMDVSPQLQQQLDQLGADFPEELTYDVYVDEQNQIRRTSIVLGSGATELAIDVVTEPLTEPVVIELPAAADVTDIADLI